MQPLEGDEVGTRRQTILSQIAELNRRMGAALGELRDMQDDEEGKSSDQSAARTSDGATPPSGDGTTPIFKNTGGGPRKP